MMDVGLYSSGLHFWLKLWNSRRRPGGGAHAVRNVLSTKRSSTGGSSGRRRRWPLVMSTTSSLLRRRLRGGATRCKAPRTPHWYLQMNFIRKILFFLVWLGLSFEYLILPMNKLLYEGLRSEKVYLLLSNHFKVWSVLTRTQVEIYLQILLV